MWDQSKLRWQAIAIIERILDTLLKLLHDNISHISKIVVYTLGWIHWKLHVEEL